MADTEIDAKQIERRVSDLAQAMERVRNDIADRDDVVVEMKQARLARLELLAKDLQPTFDEVPDDAEQFEFALAKGETPRLWIDATTHVRMGRDRREYEFVKDTRAGRSILGRSADRPKMTGMVQTYIAERLLERERIMEGEWVAMRGYDFDGGRDAEAVEPARDEKGSYIAQILAYFALGLLAGGTLAYLWSVYGDQIRQYFTG